MSHGNCQMNTSQIELRKKYLKDGRLHTDVSVTPVIHLIHCLITIWIVVSHLPAQVERNSFRRSHFHAKVRIFDKGEPSVKMKRNVIGILFLIHFLDCQGCIAIYLKMGTLPFVVMRIVYLLNLSQLPQAIKMTMGNNPSLE